MSTFKVDVLQSRSGGATTFTGQWASKAWVNFDGTAATITPTAAGNVGSLTDNGVGDYTANFTTSLPDANYNFLGQGYAGGAQYQIAGGSQGTGTVRATTSLRLQYGYVSSIAGVLTNQDPTRAYLVILGN